MMVNEESSGFQLFWTFGEKSADESITKIIVSYDFNPQNIVILPFVFLLCAMLCTAAVLRTHPVITKFGTRRRGLTAYVLTQEEMIKKHYPVKGEISL